MERSSFGQLFGETWKEYWGNFKGWAPVMLIFLAIPSFIYNLYSRFFVSEGDLANISWQIGGVSFLLFIILFFVQFYGMGAITIASLKKKKFSMKYAQKEFRGHFWRYIGYSLVVMFFMICLFILLIIPGIIFMVYWMLGVYVFLGEKKGIMDSLRESRRLVKGNWWRVFGMFLIVMIGVMVLGGILGGLFGFFIFAISEVAGNVAVSLVNTILQFFYVPFFIIFYKNVYLKLKAKKF